MRSSHSLDRLDTASTTIARWPTLGFFCQLPWPTTSI